MATVTKGDKGGIEGDGKRNALAAGQSDEAREVAGRRPALVPHSEEELEGEGVHFVEVEEKGLERRCRRVCGGEQEQATINIHIREKGAGDWQKADTDIPARK